MVLLSNIAFFELAVNAVTHSNAVLTLRRQELAQSTRAFRARGGKAIRCDTCVMPQSDCMCADRPSVSSQSAFCFLMYKGEVYKPSNTGRLICDVAADNHAFLWDRTQPDPHLLALLQDPRYAPIVVFPHEYAGPERCIMHPQQVPAVIGGKQPLFVMLDGTWREAKKMFRSPYLASLPVLGIQPQQVSAYLMRDAAAPHQLCTAEIGIAILRLMQDDIAADALASYFTLFCQRYTLVRPHLLEKDRTISACPTPL